MKYIDVTNEQEVTSYIQELEIRLEKLKTESSYLKTALKYYRSCVTEKTVGDEAHRAESAFKSAKTAK